MLASDAVRRAYRRSNVISINRSPTTAEQTEGLEHLNGFVLSVVGNEAGNELSDLNIGGEFDQSSLCSQYVPENARLVCNAGGTFDLHPQPYDGQRVALADAAAIFASSNLILNGNGRRIETAASVTLSTNSLSRQWLYRADLGNWVRISELVAADTVPFPTEFDNYIVTGLAMLVNPGFEAELSPEGRASFDRSERQIRARYRKPRPPQDSGALGMMGQSGFSGGAGDLLR